MDEIRELIVEGNSGEQIEVAAGKVNEAIIKACTESMPRRKEFKGTVPWWTPELTEQRREVRKLRKISQRAAATNDGTKEDKKRAYTTVFNNYKTALLRTRQDKWKEFCTDNSQHDPWGPAYRVLRRKKKAPNMTTVRREDGTTTDGWKETTELLLERFFPEDKAEEDTPAQTIERQEAASTTGGADDRDITEAEIGRAIGTMNPKKAPGYDWITADIAKRAFETNAEEITTLMNKCLKFGTFPACWKKAEVKLIPKPGKTDMADPGSYRPISLLPVLGKVLDNIMIKRIEHFIENSGGFSERQYGFSRGRSTVDAIEEVVKTVNEARERGNYCTAISLDVAGAFDNAWWPLIIKELGRRNCPDNLIRLTRGYLSDRIAAVAGPDSEITREVTMGCPQGSRSGPGYWKVLYDGIFSTELPQGCSVIGFADDTMLLVQAAQQKRLKTTANNALNILQQWAEQTRIKFNPAKSQALYFGKRAGQARPTFRMGTGRIRCTETIKYLGVTLDDRLQWGHHITEVCAKSKRTSHQLRAACKLTWGLGRESMARIYEGAIQPAVTYAAPVWAGAVRRKKEAKKLLSVQRISAIGTAAAYRTTGTEALLVISGLTPIDLKVIEIADQRDITRNRANERARAKAELSDEDQVESIETERTSDHPAEDKGTKFEVGEPVEDRVRIYTDGSRGAATAGAAMVVFAGEREIWNERYKLDSRCTAQQCELVAIRGALRYIARHNYAIRKCAIATDCIQALQTIGNTTKPTQLTGEIQTVIANIKANGVVINWHWTKAHTGIRGNERADQLAKEAAMREEQEPDYKAVPPSHIKRTLMSHTRRTWDDRWQEADTGRLTAAFIPNLATRETMVTAVKRLSYQTVQLITGHGNFGSYLKRFAKKEDSTCECGDPEETAEHVLFECALEEEARRTAMAILEGTGTTWPTNLQEATLNAGRPEWWTALSEFARNVNRLKVDSER